MPAKKLGDYEFEEFRKLIDDGGVVRDEDKPAWMPKGWKLLVPVEEMTTELIDALKAEAKWARAREVKDLKRVKRAG